MAGLVGGRAAVPHAEEGIHVVEKALSVREFLEADLVDTMHVAVAPVEIGRGGRLWESPDELLDRFHLEVVPSPSGVVHHLFWRR